MGTTSSIPYTKESNAFLSALAEPESIVPPVAWKDGLASLATLNLAISTPALQDLIHSLYHYNPQTGRLLELARQVAIVLDTATCNAGSMVPHASLPNVLMLTRLCIAHATQDCKGDGTILALVFRDNGDTPSKGKSVGRHLVEALVTFITDVPVGPAVQQVHGECVHTLLTMCYTTSFPSIHDQESPNRHYFLRYLAGMSEGSQANLCTALLKGYASNVLGGPTSDGRGTLWWLLPWNLFLRGSDPKKPMTAMSPTEAGARRGMWLLLTILYHGKGTVQRNGALRHLTSLNMGLGDILRSLAVRPQCEEAWLLLYFLVYDNRAFMEMCLTQARPADWLLPVLLAVYNSDVLLPDTLYVLLTLLMHVSQDGTWNTMLHRTHVRAPWYRERILGDITLGSLMIAVLVRCVQKNMLSSKDLFVTRGCLAVLANTAPSYSYLHPYAAQRLVYLVSNLSRRVCRLTASLAAGGNDDYTIQADVATHVEFLSNVLECVHACITLSIGTNPYLVYELMQQQDCLAPIADVQKLIPVVAAIMKVISHFEEHTKGVEVGTPECAIAIIEKAAKEMPEGGVSDSVYQDLKFTYEESATSEEFFLPLIWRMVRKYSAGTPLGAAQGDDETTLTSVVAS
jgi:hypothetical protein